MNDKPVSYIKACLSDLAFMDKTAGLSVIKTVKDFKLPFEKCATDIECTTDKSLAPNSKYKSIMYFKELDRPNLVKVHACNLQQYNSNIRLMFWFNHKKFGYDECIKDRLIAEIMRKLTARDCFNKASDEQYMNISVDNLSVASGDIFNDYDYRKGKICDAKFFTDPYEYFAIDFKLSYFFSYSCLEEFTINPEIEC